MLDVPSMEGLGRPTVALTTEKTLSVDAVIFPAVDELAELAAIEAFASALQFRCDR